MILVENERETLRKLLVRIASEWNAGNKTSVIDEIYELFQEMDDGEKKEVIRFLIGLKKMLL